MKGSECKFVKYMEGADKRFVIPVYQRNYDWKLENCKQLYDDLVKIIKGRRKSHFLEAWFLCIILTAIMRSFLLLTGSSV